MEPDKSINVLGGALSACSSDPVTGFFRDGHCNTCAADHAALRFSGNIRYLDNASGFAADGSEYKAVHLKTLLTFNPCGAPHSGPCRVV